MKKLLILIALLFATYMFADTNTSNTNNTNSVKTKSKINTNRAFHLSILTAYGT